MNVFLVEPSLTANQTNEILQFGKIVKEELEKYIIINMVVSTNLRRCEKELTKDSLIIFFCDKNRELEETSSVYRFLNSAKRKDATIWPVAMSKDDRIPPNIVSKKQCYDVGEQLRCRDLSSDYLGSVARAFARKVISRVLPTIYDENGLIFVSHRRVDGEELTAELCDQIIVQSKESKVFRDVTEVQVGEEAQEKIDEAMAKSDLFIFIHTEMSAESEWIRKELSYALLRQVPVLWVQIDDAEISGLKIKPSDYPHLKYASSDIQDDDKRTQIVDQILHTGFEIVMERSNQIYDFENSLIELFGDSLKGQDRTQMLYKVTAPRKGYHHPQRDIRQYIQVFGRTPTKEDFENLQRLITEDDKRYDSVAILTDRIVKSEINGKIVKETFEDYYYNWQKFLSGDKKRKDMEIVISGAFPEGEEIYKQRLTDALVIFAKSIIRRGYTLTFGSHPTFQELLFEIAQAENSNYNDRKLKMYISKFFEKFYKDNKEKLAANADLVEIEKYETREKSLGVMREKMIQRNSVAAIICLGGKTDEDKKNEGIREEVRIAREAGVPAFLVGTVGGCSSVLATEFKNSGWHHINSVSDEINELFMDSMNYLSISEKLLDVLEK